MNKHIFISVQQSTGLKTFGVGTIEEIRQKNDVYRQLTNSNMEFTKVVKDLTEKKVWSLYYFLKFSNMLNARCVGYNDVQQTFIFDDSKSEKTLEEFIDYSLEGILQWNSFTDVTHHYQQEGWDKYAVEEVKEEEVSSEELF